MTSLEYEMARSNRESDRTLEFAGGVFIIEVLIVCICLCGYLAWGFIA